MICAPNLTANQRRRSWRQRLPLAALAGQRGNDVPALQWVSRSAKPQSGRHEVGPGDFRPTRQQRDPARPYDYRDNFTEYPHWLSRLRKANPPAVGPAQTIRSSAGPAAQVLKRDVPTAEVHFSKLVISRGQKTATKSPNTCSEGCTGMSVEPPEGATIKAPASFLHGSP